MLPLTKLGGFVQTSVAVTRCIELGVIAAMVDDYRISKCRLGQWLGEPSTSSGPGLCVH